MLTEVQFLHFLEACCALLCPTEVRFPYRGSIPYCAGPVGRLLEPCVLSLVLICLLDYMRPAVRKQLLTTNCCVPSAHVLTHVRPYVCAYVCACLTSLLPSSPYVCALLPTCLLPSCLSSHCPNFRVLTCVLTRSSASSTHTPLLCWLSLL